MIKSFKRGLTALAVGAAVMLGGMTPSNAIPAEELDKWAMVDAVRTVRISPDGSEVGILRSTSIRGPYVLEVYKTKDLTKKPKRFGGSDDWDLVGFQWVGDGYLWLNIVKEEVKGNSSRFLNRQAITKSDGSTNWLRVEENRSVRFVDRLRGKKDWVLIADDADFTGRGFYIPDLLEYNIKNGRTRTVFQGTSKIPGNFIIDFDGNVRGAFRLDPANGAIEYYGRRTDEDGFTLVKRVTRDDRENFDIVGIDYNDPNRLLVRTNAGENTSGIYSMDIATRQLSEQALFRHKVYDATGVFFSRNEEDFGRIIGYTYTGKGPRIYFTDEKAKAEQKALEQLFGTKDVFTRSTSDDRSVRIVETLHATDPGSMYLVKDGGQPVFLANRRPELRPEMLNDVKYVSYKARDGMKIRAYLTIPAAGEAPFPTVVMPHGGPWARDTGGFDDWAQFMANQGYLVIQPQFRGSLGLGMELWKAGDAKWGLEMQEDLQDAAFFLVENGLADPERLAMHGFSYGGYAALVASFREDSPFKCAISGAPVGDLNSWRALINRSRRLSVFQEPAVQGINPVEHAKKINKPLLMMHGTLDNTVHINHARWFDDAVDNPSTPYKFVEIPGMGHGPFEYEHRKTYFSEMINWLDTQCFVGPQVASAE